MPYSDEEDRPRKSIFFYFSSLLLTLFMVSSMNRGVYMVPEIWSSMKWEYWGDLGDLDFETKPCWTELRQDISSPSAITKQKAC